jgi:hypothetical protein
MGALYLKPIDDAMDDAMAKLDLFAPVQMKIGPVSVSCLAVWAIAPVPSRGDDRGYRQNGWPTRWKLRRAVKRASEILNELHVEQHPDKTFVGRISRGFDFLGDDFSPAGITGIVAFRSAKVALLSPAVWAIAPVPSRGDDRGYRQNGGRCGRCSHWAIRTTLATVDDRWFGWKFTLERNRTTLGK